VVRDDLADYQQIARVEVGWPSRGEWDSRHDRPGVVGWLHGGAGDRDQQRQNDAEQGPDTEPWIGLAGSLLRA
jgi:hypothetical protein